jgi:Tfp pilus assembly protein PilN
MTDAQLYLAIGLPTITALVGILVNIGYFIVTNSRIQRLEEKIDILTGKVADMDTEMARVEEHLGMK